MRDLGPKKGLACSSVTSQRIVVAVEVPFIHCLALVSMRLRLFLRGIDIEVAVLEPLTASLHITHTIACRIYTVLYSISSSYITMTDPEMAQALPVLPAEIISLILRHTLSLSYQDSLMSLLNHHHADEAAQSQRTHTSHLTTQRPPRSQPQAYPTPTSNQLLISKFFCLSSYPETLSLHLPNDCTLSASSSKSRQLFFGRLRRLLRFELLQHARATRVGEANEVVLLVGCFDPSVVASETEGRVTGQVCREEMRERVEGFVQGVGGLGPRKTPWVWTVKDVEFWREADGVMRRADEFGKDDEREGWVWVFGSLAFVRKPEPKAVA